MLLTAFGTLEYRPNVLQEDDAIPDLRIRRGVEISTASTVGATFWGGKAHACWWF